MSDYLIKAVGAANSVRVFAAVTTAVVEEARKRHQTTPVATAALGRTLTAGLLLGANLKGEELVTVRVLGNGPLGVILVTADAKGAVKGYFRNRALTCPPKDTSCLSGGPLEMDTCM